MCQFFDKKSLRQQIIQCRNAINPLDRKHASLAAANKVLAWPLYKRAKIVMLFAGVRSEIDTRFLVEESLRLGKQVAMPRCVPENRELLLLKIESWEDLQPSYYGLLEPIAGANSVSAAELELIVVPGVVFSPTGYRIGYGGGYYDRLLARLTNVVTVGLAFQLQVVNSLPQDPHDRPVDYLVSEKMILDCKAIRSKQVAKGDAN